MDSEVKSKLAENEVKKETACKPQFSNMWRTTKKQNLPHNHVRAAEQKILIVLQIVTTK